MKFIKTFGYDRLRPALSRITEAAWFRRLYHSDIVDIFRQFVHISRLLSPTARRWLLTIHFMRLTSSLMSTAVYMLFAVILLIFNDIEKAMGHEYILWLSGLLEIESQRWFLVLIMAIFMVVLLTDRIFSIFAVWIEVRNDAYLSNEIVVSVYGYYLVQDYHYHPERDHSEMVGKVGGIATAIVNKVLHPPIMVISTFLNLFAIIGGLFYMNVLVTPVLVMAIVLYYGVLYKALKKRAYHYGRIQYQNSISISRLVRDGLSAYTDIMFMGKEREFVSHFAHYKRENMRYSLRMALINAIAQPMLRMLGMLFICILGIYMVMVGLAGEALSQIAVFAVAGLRVLPMAGSLYATIQNVQSRKHTYEQVLPDLEASIEWRKQKDLSIKEPLAFRRELRLDNVSFSYPGQTAPAVDGVSLRVPAGGTVAMCGRSGSGKTTVGRLICGLLEPQKGAVCVDGNDLWRDLKTRRRWHRALSFLQRNAFFMNATIAKNVAFELDNAKIDRERVGDALERACLKDFVDGLDNGVDTAIGEGAVLLSSGQAQRLSIARAIYHDTSMLLLDESTSALDAITERKVLDNFGQTDDVKTVFVIAHHINLMRDADIIFVMDGGRLVAQGTYDELMRTSKLFQGLVGEKGVEPAENNVRVIA